MPLASTNNPMADAKGVFLARILERTVIWTANRDNPPTLADVTMNFMGDGRLVLQSTQGNESAIVDNPPESATSASMINLGNFVL